MKQLYTFSVAPLKDESKPDVVRWASIYDVIAQNSPLVDRCGIIQMPYNLKLYDAFKMPRDLNGFNMTYEECCNSRAQELVELSRKLDKKITLFYSGGIDSTLLVVTFMKLLSPEEFKSRIEIALSWNSINENPNFYYNYIRPIGNIVPSEGFGNMFDGSTIIVAGEHNDQLFGSDIIGRAANRVSDFYELHKPYSRAHVVGYLKLSMDEGYANFFFDLIDGHIKQAPCEISTNFHFWWWLNFSFKWQNVFFRMLFRTNKAHRSTVNQLFVDNYFHHFYSTTNFQKWSMLNHHLKVMHTWESYKWEAKRVIYEFNGDEEYRDTKIKIGSLVEIFRQRNTPIALTTDYEFLEKINPAEYYVPNNSFL